ncbi:MAG: molybdopterin-dependent oxidoreductase [Candidatus Odinarchaeota archaeon]|nr:molybdopterin-dependent oxidoreductase [Candidatus Odinarchaeota archaeon]
MILAYKKNGEYLTEKDGGPLRMAFVEPDGLLTDGHYWVKFVVEIKIKLAVEEWNLTLRGIMSKFSIGLHGFVDRSVLPSKYIKYLCNCLCHNLDNSQL